MGMTQLQLGGEYVAPALASLESAVELDPADGKGYHSLGDAHAALQQWEQAAAAYRQATALRPGHAGGWAGLGNTLEELNKGDEAETVWRKSLSLQPDAGVYNNLGSYLRRSDRMQESRTAYEQAIALEPTNAESYIGLGKCFQAAADALTDENKAQTAKSYIAHLKQTYGVALALQACAPKDG